MAIQSPAALAAKTKKVRILIGGHPGIGKSTVALSAPRPLHIDVDRGVDRVEARFRKAFIQPVNYEELLSDLSINNPELNEFETLVFDTGGQLIKLMSSWAIRQNNLNGQRDGSLSLKGYGAVGREFERFMNYCYYELNKHIVVVFHAKEEKDGDNTRLRLLVEGQTKDNVWQPMDLGGFMEMYNNNRALGLSNCERYYAKGTHGIKGIIPIPELKHDSKNDFLTLLFNKIDENIAEETKIFEVEEQGYQVAINDAEQIINSIVSAETANEAIVKMSGIAHVLTSEKEAKAMFKKKIKSLGLAYDKKEGAYKCVS